jgi:hypothetical protein
VSDGNKVHEVEHVPGWLIIALAEVHNDPNAVRTISCVVNRTRCTKAHIYRFLEQLFHPCIVFAALVKLTLVEFTQLLVSWLSEYTFNG